MRRILLAVGLLASLAACRTPVARTNARTEETAGPSRTSEASSAEAPIRIEDGQRVLFLGDSITHNGTYVAYLEACARTRFPHRSFDFVAIGLGSETVSGLTEKGHPFPRPDVHERLARALEMVEPDLVIACYGMNDGIYHPPSEERFKAFRDGVTALVGRVRDAGAKIVLVTPPPFDVVSRRRNDKRVAPAGLDDYSYMAPYESYDEVLAMYSKWIMAFEGDGVRVIDVHTPLLEFLKARREIDASFELSGDGVHPSREGHLLMAMVLIDALLGSGADRDATIDAAAAKAIAGPVEKVTRNDTELRFAWNVGIPLARDSSWSDSFVGGVDFVARLHPARLTIRGLAPGDYELVETESSRVVGRFHEIELAAGIEFFRSPSSRTEIAEVILNRVQGRRRLLDDSWREHVGHKRPGVRPAPPLQEILPRAANMEKAIRAALQAEPLRLVLRPAGS